MLAATSPEQLFKTTDTLCRIPSISRDRERCHECLDWIRESLPNFSSFYSEVFEYEGYQSLIINTRPGRKAPLILNGHVDVVSAPEHQFTPQSKEDGTLWGRGTYDMKGAVAVYVELLRKLAALPEADRPDLQIQFVSDEEIGGHRGVERMVDEGFDTELFLAGEPTNLDICNQAKGVLWVKLKVPGVPGHSARPWLCKNPLVAISHGIHQLFGRFPVPSEAIWQTTATVTGIDVGENSHNRVPDLAEVKIDLRYVPQDDPAEIQSFLKSLFPDAELELVQLAVGLYTPEDDPKLQALRALGSEVLGREPALFSEHFASDARYYSAKGTPALCWGPSGAGMHADNEHVEMESLLVYSRIIDRLVAEIPNL